jgi:RNA polymerase sigma-70 factor (ECF subfamily)
VTVHNPEQWRWFEEEIHPHEPLLRAWLKRQFPFIRDPDDIVQEVYVRVLQAHNKGEIRAPKAFLFTTAGNLVRNHLRHLRHEQPNALTETPPSVVLDQGTAIPEALARAEEIEILTQAIQSLPARCRQVFTMRRIYGLPQREVAARLGISEHTVEAQSTIALHKCVEFFRRHSRNGPTGP